MVATTDKERMNAVALANVKGVPEGRGEDALIPVEQYRAYVATLSKLMDVRDEIATATADLHVDMSNVRAALAPLITTQAIRLANELVDVARVVSGLLKESDGGGFYLDRLWAALGRYGYADGENEDATILPLLNLAYVLEELYKRVALTYSAEELELAEAEADEPEIVSPGAQPSV